MTDNKLLFAANLKYLRLKNQMEQLELANLLGRKSASSVSEWEKGKYTPKTEILNQIAALFKVDVGALIAHDLTQENYKFASLDCGNIQVISEQLDTPHYNALLNYAQVLLKEQEAETEENK